MQDFVHLHVHTQYSLLDGQASVARLVDKAMKNGMKGIAVTDHGNMFGIKEFTRIKRRRLLLAKLRSWKRKTNYSNRSSVVKCMWHAVPWT